MRLVGRGGPHTLRPERITVLDVSDPQPPGAVMMDGELRDIVFLGSLTRYRVDVGSRADIIVLAQNLDGPPEPDVVASGRKVRLAFAPAALRPVSSDVPELSTTNPETRGTAP
jgi:putative spermidine/putrescine transport system ATP-binding protein